MKYEYTMVKPCCYIHAHNQRMRLTIFYMEKQDE